ERLSALGELAAGINHNLNNILVGVTVSSEFLLEDVEDPEIRERIEVIFRAGRQAADLVARLQDAMLGESEEGALRSVNEVIREAVEAARPRWKDEAELKGHEIAVELDLSHDLPAIRGSSSGLYNLMLNLLFNAVDALPNGGSIEIRSMVVGEGIQLSVRDTGVGMDEETAKRVFEPFFTTKVQIGTGLGLSTVYNTIVGWGGKIDVDSVSGAGTVFTIWLPSAEVGLEGSLAFSNATAVESGRVLVVDDQDIVTELVHDILVPTHEVTSTHTGEIALQLLDGEDYDVVMLDLGMPGIPGDQVALKIRDTVPDVALVLMTGWRLRDDDARLALFDFHLCKPLSNLNRVRDVVRRAVRLRRVRREELN
ncbi:MAG: ATP-binding protein, partial [Candidatus Latescibacteria bacterium]|nr:ATP-binding protein [Candidatus Latescibacterota bacterium]